MLYASILSTYAFHFIFIYAFRFYFTYMISLIYSKWTLNLGKELMLQFNCNTSLFVLIMQHLYSTYLLYSDCLTFRHFAQPPPNHTSIALYVSPFLHVSLLSCHYATDTAMICHTWQIPLYCRHSYDCNYVSLLCFTLSL